MSPLFRLICSPTVDGVIGTRVDDDPCTGTQEFFRTVVKSVWSHFTFGKQYLEVLTLDGEEVRRGPDGEKLVYQKSCAFRIGKILLTTMRSQQHSFPVTKGKEEGTEKIDWPSALAGVSKPSRLVPEHEANATFGQLYDGSDVAVFQSGCPQNHNVCRDHNEASSH